MKALILNGCKMEDSEMTRVHNLMLDELKKLNWEMTSITLEEIDLAFCIGCFGCWIQTPGECVIKDYQAKILEQIVHSDLVIFFTPITFGGYSSALKKAIDRHIGLVLPYFMKVNGEIHHKQRYEKRESLLGIGILDKPDVEKEDVFKTLVVRNSINADSPSQQAIVFIKGQDSLDFCNTFNKALMKVEVI